jgi:hypothetical protein
MMSEYKKMVNENGVEVLVNIACANCIYFDMSSSLTTGTHGKCIKSRKFVRDAYNKVCPCVKVKA